MKKEENLDRIRIVLVEPEDSANIGSVCRAIKTQGITHLYIVSNNNFNEKRLKSLAVHAYDIYEHSLKVKTLKEALDNTVLSVAFTRRKGKFRKLSSWNPKELFNVVQKFGEGDIALVFGRESNGLTDDEVEQCSVVCTIETSPLFPSLNLSQSVQIAAYMLNSNLSDYNNPSHIITNKDVDDSVKNAIKALSDMGYFKEKSDEKESYATFIKDFISRGSFSLSEKARIDKFFTKLSLISRYKTL